MMVRLSESAANTMQMQRDLSEAGSAESRHGRVFPVGQGTLFALVIVVFFLWGMSNNLTDTLVQQFRKSFELNLIEAQLVQTSVFPAYGTMAIPAALQMRRFYALFAGYVVVALCGFFGSDVGVHEVQLSPEVL
jgi:FHS family L-fucose permease-like MFS transporter